MTSEPSKNPAAGRKIILSEYFNDSPRETLLLRRELFNAEIAQAIYDMRQLKGLTQAQLAKRVGTTASVISRLEDVDYGGRSLDMLLRITSALGLQLTLSLTPDPSRDQRRPKSTRKPRRPAA